MVSHIGYTVVYKVTWTPGVSMVDEEKKLMFSRPIRERKVEFLSLFSYFTAKYEAEDH